MIEEIDRRQIEDFVRDISEKVGYTPFRESAHLIRKIAEGNPSERMQIPFRDALRAYLSAEAETRITGESQRALLDLAPAIRGAPSIPCEVDFI